MFLLWLSNSNAELRCGSCGKTIIRSYVSWVSYISMVPMIYASSYVVDNIVITSARPETGIFEENR
jgi:hypothetical protein